MNARLLVIATIGLTAVTRADHTSAQDHQHAAVAAHTDSVGLAFMDKARAATVGYHDRAEAIRDGYRRLGPEFPGMGEHWVNPGLIVRGVVDPTRPHVLCYARIGGKPTLVAVAFAVPLLAGEIPPAEPLGPGIWHDHSGTIDAESLLLLHPSSHARASDGARLAMFHAWVGLENPDGPFAENNWVLPFTQLGIAAPMGGRSLQTAAQAVSLVTAPDRYYHDLFIAAVELDASETAILDAILTDHREKVARILAPARPIGRFTETELAALAEVWRSLWRSIEGSVRPYTWSRLDALSPQ